MASKYDKMVILDGKGRMVHRMTRAERAKIFMPFDALKGLREALAEAERAMDDAGDTVREESPFEDLREAPEFP